MALIFGAVFSGAFAWRSVGCEPTPTASKSAVTPARANRDLQRVAPLARVPLVVRVRAGTVVTAIGISLISTSVYGPVADSGNANPDNNFRFTGDSYIFNLKTTGLSTGTYNLYLTVGADPTLHTVQFQIK